MKYCLCETLGTMYATDSSHRLGYFHTQYENLGIGLIYMLKAYIYKYTYIFAKGIYVS